MALNYFDIRYAKNVHDFIIDISGGLHGLNDIRLLESVLGLMQNDLYYQDFESKLTHLVYSVIKNHAFRDGNKRSSIALGAYFLQINGLEYCMDRFIIEMENTVVYIADNKIDKDLLNEIISSIINEDNYGETLRLKIIEAITRENL